MTANLLNAQRPAEHRTRSPLRTVLAAAAACVALAATAAAVAPGVWDTLCSNLGSFAPYSQSIEGAVCTDQGIEMQVISELADDVQGWVYYTVRDTEENRLDDQLILDGEMTASTSEPLNQYMWVRSPAELENDQLISYDPDTRTALFAKHLWFGDSFEPVADARFHASGITMRQGHLGKDQASTVDCASVTGKILQSEPAAPADEVILSPGDVINAPYGNEVLPEEQVVLAPGQNRISISGNEDIWVTSMGMASDGCFHLRLEFAEGIETMQPPFCKAFPKSGADSTGTHDTILVRKVEKGLDILFPMLHAEETAQLDHIQFYGGSYTRPGVEMEGDWSMDFTFVYYESIVLDWTGEMEGCQATQVTVSPLSITMTLCGESDAEGWMDASARLRDGSVVTAGPGTGTHMNRGAMEGTDEEYWEIYNTWEFSEPVNVEDIVSLTVQGVQIPVNMAD